VGHTLRAAFLFCPVANHNDMTNAGYMPSRVQAGESIWIAAANTAQGRADITFDGYLPADYSLAYHFAASTPIAVAAVANTGGTGWTLDVTGAQTLAWAPGRLPFAAYATHTASGRVFAVDGGTMTVDASPLRVSAWTAVVTACDAAILQYAGNPHGNFSADGMSFSFRSLADLTNLRDYASARAAQDSASRPCRIIRARFPS